MLKKLFFYLLLFLAILFRVKQAKPDFVEGQRIKITSRITTQPIVFEKSQYFRLLDLKIYLPLYPELSYGDEVEIVGMVEGDALKNATLINHLSSDRLLDKFRIKLLSVFRRSFPADEASLVAGVVIGSKSGISQRFWENLVNSGTAHVVVASGMNVTLVGGFLLAMCMGILNRRRAIILVIVGIWMYCILCGLEAPIVRAGIMGTIAFLAQESGRLNQAGRALMITGYIMVFVNPGWIVDIGFLLSFAATASLILFSNKVEKYLSYIQITKKLPLVVKESFVTTIAAQVLIVPVLFITFGKYNPFSIVANALTLWVIPIITVAGFVAGILGAICFPLGRVVLITAYPLARYFTFVIQLFGR